MRTAWVGLLTCLAITLSIGEAEAARTHKLREPPLPAIVIVNISVSSQSLYLSVNGWPTGTWQVSTAGVGYHTPRGTFRVQRMAKDWFSRKYDNSPMPNSLFFDGGIAIHGTNHVRNIGRPVSHGCVRLLPQDAERLYTLVEQYGAKRTQITVTD